MTSKPARPALGSRGAGLTPAGGAHSQGVAMEIQFPTRSKSHSKAKNGRVRSELEHELGEKIAFRQNQAINLAEEPPRGGKITDSSCQGPFLCYNPACKAPTREVPSALEGEGRGQEKVPRGGRRAAEHRPVHKQAANLLPQEPNGK